MRENLYYNTMHTFKNDMVGVHGIGDEFRNGVGQGLWLGSQGCYQSALSLLIHTVTN